MREVTFQIVMRLREADDKEVRLVEDALTRIARRQLIFTDETVSVAKLMDREVRVIDEVDKELDRMARKPDVCEVCACPLDANHSWDAVCGRCITK